jgi:hypothetical protein
MKPERGQWWTHKRGRNPRRVLVTRVGNEITVQDDVTSQSYAFLPREFQQMYQRETIEK